MRRPGNSLAISCGEDLKGSGFSLNQVVSMRSPRTRSSTPRAMVSTSGSSGMAHLLIIVAGAWPLLGAVISSGVGYKLQEPDTSCAAAPDLSANISPHPLRRFEDLRSKGRAGRGKVRHTKLIGVHAS